jgi:hypothetical protein
LGDFHLLRSHTTHYRHVLDVTTWLDLCSCHSICTCWFMWNWHPHVWNIRELITGDVMPWGIGLYHLVHCAITILSELYRKVSAQCKASCQGDTQHKHTQNWDCDSSHMLCRWALTYRGCLKKQMGLIIKEKTFF